MLSLTIGIPETDHNNRLYLDDIAYFDLLNRIGPKLRQIGSLDVSQIKIALGLAETGGYIRWHKLWTERGTISSTDWHVNTYKICFGLVEPAAGMSPNVLDLPNLYKLVQDLGLDLINLWKLERVWVVDMFKRLNDLHFVNGLVMEGTVLPGQALAEIISAGNTFKSLSPFLRFSSILTVETYTDLTQSTPSIPSTPLPSVLPLPTSDPLPSNTIYYPLDAGLEFDRAIQDHGSMEPSTSSPSVPNTDDADSPVMASLQSVDNPPGPDAGPSSYPTLSTYDVNSFTAGEPLALPSSGCNPQPYQAANTPQSVSTPYSTSAATPVEFVNTPGPDAGASSYPTPSTHYANSPRVDEPITRLSSSVLPLNQAVEALESTRNSPTQQQTREQTIIRSLQSCTFTDENVRLNNKQIRGIIKAGARLLSQDPFRILRPLLDNAGNTSSSLEKLGLPDEWEGINGAANYFRVLDKDKDKKIRLDTLARRVGQIIVYLNYESLCKKGEPDVAPILDAYHDDPNKSKGEKFRRGRFSTYHVRLGKWWWRLAACLGFGILLVADDIVKNMLNDTFSNDQINALITFALRTRPGTIHLYRSLEPVAMLLLSGKLPANLRQILMDANTGLLRYDALEDARTKDENASRSQETAYPWKVENTKPYAEKTATDFLHHLRSRH
ncbi:hypothetical protein CNMCM6106_001027 [Aspergillus hiratsukae]|uniref:Uncharacterized protein n=1 Tax=Aspergillus hiratsukae TaxID=1194566 RepID=A0A8H6Q2A6_9EURO|nr:hypothetical protein CNMCM6106_001027 [Aspergillus hiratsukae]